MTVAPAPDDIVATHAEAERNDRPPLLVVEPLRAFLDEHGLGSGALAAEPVGTGHSNVTYVVRRGDEEVVVRRPPRPPLPPSAHDVLREARLLRALEGTAARVPRVLAACDDEAVIGAPFYVMERLTGDVITSEVPPALDTPAERGRIGEELIDALVEVHAVDWEACGLEGFGKPTGYLERQLRRFGGLWETARTRELPAVERVGEWLAAHLPESGPATIVHGDFRLGNTMFAPGAPARLIAVFDWEMATIGDPLADIGYLCATWSEAGDPVGGRFELGRVTRAEGFPDRAALIARYEERAGRAVRDLRWYTTLALWKSVVFMEGNYRRAIEGRTDDPYLKSFGEGVLELAARAEAVAFGEG
jgi:aminoglycoside phosphotransferase (APT) family kinase protein